MSICNRLDLQTQGSQPVMPKNLPDHCPQCDLRAGILPTQSSLNKKTAKASSHWHTLCRCRQENERYDILIEEH